MVELNIHLQDGFAHDTVIVCVDGHEVLRKSDVTTRTQIGLADMVTTEVPAGPAEVEVDVPTRGTRSTIRVTVPEVLYIGVSVEPDGRLTHRATREIMGYA